jgi:hypothetical protein
MDEGQPDKRQCIDYWKAVRRLAPHTKLFPLPRVIAPLVVALANFIVARYRHEQHPKSLPSPVGKEVLIFAAVTIVVYMILYVCEWSWNSVVMSPPILDKQRTDKITDLTKKLEESSRQSQTGNTFASLIETGRAIELRMFTSRTGAEFSPLSLQFNDWCKCVEGALIESGLQTDASIFAHSGERLSQEQIKTFIPSYIQKETWKHYDIARITVCLAKLQEIIERRNL